MTLLRFERHSGFYPPERELLTVEDSGAFSMWRSYGGGRAGRFAGTVPDVGRARDLAASVADAEHPEVTELEPDASVEVVRVGEAEIEVEAGIPVEGAWGELWTYCREQLRTLTSQPSAAIGGALLPDGVLRLEHLGSQPLPIELTHLDVEVVSWLDGVERASSRTRPEGLGPVDATPGWTLDVDVDPSVLEAGLVVGTATFVATDDGVFVPVVVTAWSG